MKNSTREIRKSNQQNQLGKSLLIIIFLFSYFSFISNQIMNIYGEIFFLTIPLLSTIILLKKYMSKKTRNYLIFLVFFIASMFLSILINKGGVGSVVNLAYTLFVFIVISELQYNYYDIKWIFYITLFLNIYLVLQAPGYYEVIILQGQEGMNPNVMAYVILFTAMLSINIIEVVTSKHLFLKRNVIFILSLTSILQLNARGSLVTLLIYYILEFIIPKKSFEKRPNLLFHGFILVIVVGTFFPWIYTWLFNNSVGMDTSLSGKNFYSGREIIWSIFFKNMDSVKEWLFGLGSNFELIAGEALDLHNNFLGIIGNFGVVSFIAYFIFLLKIIKSICESGNLKKSTISMLIAFSCVFINGIFEATIYFSPVFILMFVFLGLASSFSKKRLTNNQS